MTTTITATGVTTAKIDPPEAAPGSAVSWGAILAGAAAAAALSLILFVLGAGLGFAVTSPWTATSATATALGGAAIAWLALTQILASATGGYIAGRLRSYWSGVHGDEVYFRDTAHGLLAWAVATLATAAFLASAIAGALGGVARVGGDVAKGAATAATAATAAAASDSGPGTAPTPYFVDSLFRSDAAAPAVDANDAQTRAEAMRIFVHDLRASKMGPEDVRYLGQVVSRRTGLTPADAEKRVADAFTRTSEAITQAENAAKQAADEARRAAAATSLWMFISLLASAFCASLAALYGGRRRDAYIV